MRSEFEKLPEIATHLHNVVFDVGYGEYLPKQMGYIAHEFSAYFLNGAYYAFQEQQKKIYKVLGAIKMQERYQDRQIDCLCDEIKDLLK